MAKFDGTPPSGTRDFFGDALKRRESAIAVIKRVFESFGFQPLETPAFERLELLAGKYGEDEKLIFKIAKRGAKAAGGDADLALRYDLTVPLARFVANRDLKREGVFKRYQIGPVWRADRPGHGRYREFFQCDADIVGSDSPLADAEVVLAVTETLRALGLGRFAVRLNSRKALSALMSAYGVPDALHADGIAAIDKLYKAGVDGVARELASRGIPAEAIARFEADQASGSPPDAVGERLDASPEGQTAHREVRRVKDLVGAHIRGGEVVFDPFVARGLDYYTGVIFEVFYVEDPERLPLSVVGGGRYDDLIGMSTKGPVPACGGSLGFERIMLLLDEQAIDAAETPRALVTVWDETQEADAFAIAADLRAAGIGADVYLGSSGLGAQLRYAARQGRRACVIRGPDEQVRGDVTVRDLDSGEQRSGPRDDVARLVGDLLKAGEAVPAG